MRTTLGARRELERIVRWYATVAYGRWDGGRRLPFYCDSARIGRFAVSRHALRAGREDALFQLLVTMSMYQSRRDVDIMALQRRIPANAAAELTHPSRLAALVAGSRCELLGSPARFDANCEVRRDFKRARGTCDYRPRTPCHVKVASHAIGRMGDMGKIPTSAWLHLEAAGGFNSLIAEARLLSDNPAHAAENMVKELTRIHGIGVKLATMFVSALSTPALSPNLTPWWPVLDGNHLVVVDTNVARVVDALRPTGPKTYAARATWLRRIAAKINLQDICRSWPATSPRLVQQAVYTFRSASNRIAAGDPCAKHGPCEHCVSKLCPFRR